MFIIAEDHICLPVWRAANKSLIFGETPPNTIFIETACPITSGWQKRKEQSPGQFPQG